MRITAGLIFASSISLLLAGAAWAQTPPATKGAAAPQAAAAPKAAPAPAAAPAAAAPQTAAAPAAAPATAQPARAACTNPNALGVARTVEIDTTGGPGFGFEHFKQLDFLRDKEVVLTFDDGPWPRQYARGSQGTGGRMHDRHFLPDRQARDLPSGDPEAGICGRAHRRRAHLVARQSQQQEADRGAAQGRDREGLCAR